MVLKGLTTEQVRVQRARYGTNQLQQKTARHWVALVVVAQVESPLVRLLILATFLAGFMGEVLDSLIIMSVVVLDCTLGFIVEYRAHRAIELLKKYIVTIARVMRDGVLVEIPTQDIVPNDVVFFAIGTVIPADMQLMQAENCAVDESRLTGESIPVPKQLGSDTLLRAGTTVVSGSGYGVVTAIGMHTEFGALVASLATRDVPSNFQQEMTSFGALIMHVALVFLVCVFLFNVLTGKAIIDSFVFALALVVGITPELLPLIMTVTLARGSLRMATKKVVVKRLSSIESIGNMSVLCCDKTGTLTEGAIRLYGYTSPAGIHDSRVLLYGLLCSSVQGNHIKKIFDGPIDKALWESPDAMSVMADYEQYTIVSQDPFDFNTRIMRSVVRHDNQELVIIKGAPEDVIARCKELGQRDLEALRTQVSRFEHDGMRVLAVAAQQEPESMALVGFLLFLDTIKKTAKESIAHIESLGVAVKVITGDSPTVTRKICAELALPLVEDRIVTGQELAAMSPEELRTCAQKYCVFARVTPEQKVQIVAGIRAPGVVVGFLGDGVNDAPVLKVADVGFSVNTAVDVAKDSATVILLQKSLAVIAIGIIEGRKSHGNIIKYILNIMSANFGNMTTVALSSLFLPFIPLLSTQILLNNLLCDAFLMTLPSDNVYKGYLKKPNVWNMRVIMQFMAFFGAISTVFDFVLMGVLLYVLHVPVHEYRTAWFIESSLSQIAVTFFIRTKNRFFQDSPSVLLASAGIIAATVVIIIPYTSVGPVFQLVRLPGYMLGIIGLVVASYCATVEVLKGFFFKRFE